MTTAAEKLAINGGEKAVPAFTGIADPKIGMDEFMAVARRFGFSADALARIESVVSNDDMPAGGPNLARYFSAVPAPPAGEAYEQLAREIFAVPYAATVSSGTAALHSAFVAVGVGPGTEVIVPALGFAATAQAVALAGGIPVFCDVDDSLSMDPAKIEALITPRTVALAPTHHWGNVSDMDPIMAVAHQHGLKVVEDCAQSPGGRYHGQYVGTIGDVGCFSISAYKIIGGGESGLLLTRDERVYDRARQCAESGGLWRPNRFAQPRYDGELFIGTNYRLSDMEAAVSTVQLGKMERYCTEHRRVRTCICRQLLPCREITPQTINDPDGAIGYQLRFFPATFELATAIAAALSAEGISAAHRTADHAPDWHLARDMFPVVLRAGHIPGGSVFDDPRNAASREQASYRPGANPVSEDLYAREISIGFDRGWNDTDCDNVARGINKVLTAFCTPDANARPWR